MYYPLMIDLKGKLICIVGGGKVAYRKARKILEYEGNIKIISPNILEEFYDLEKQYIGSLIIIKKSFKEEYLDKAFMVIGATNSEETNKKVSVFCNINKIPCNIVDSMEFSDFIVPSTIKRGDLIISVSTMGSSPSLCSKIRKELEQKYGEEYGLYVKALGEIRNKVILKYKDENHKKEILNSIVDMDLEELMKFKDEL